MDTLSISSPNTPRRRDRLPRLADVRMVLSLGAHEFGRGLASSARAPYLEALTHFRSWPTAITWARLRAASRQLLVTTQAERRAR